MIDDENVEIAAEQHAEKETREWCELVGVPEFDTNGFRTEIADSMYQKFYKQYMFPDVDYTVGNTGNIPDGFKGHK